MATATKALPDLRSEVEQLHKMLGEAECDHQKAQQSYADTCAKLARGETGDVRQTKHLLDHAIALKLGLESELSSKRSALDKLDADEAESRARDQVKEALRLAGENIRSAKAELDRLDNLFRSLPDQIRKAQSDFSRALSESSNLKRKLGIL
ncbi:MAG: hypothetical protein WB952_05795 [Terriglobales bacterium]